MLEQNAEIDAKVWIDAGTLARALGRLEDAERCLSRAVEVAVSDEQKRAARRALGEVHIAAAAYRDAALILIPTLEAEKREGRERALELQRIGALFKKDGDLFMAAGWLDDALNEDPSCAEAAIALVEIYAAREDRVAVAELSAKVERAQLAMAQRAGWLTALGEAKRTLGDRSGAHDSFALALVSDPLLIAPAESLIALGREASNNEWIDDGLRELRARALARGSRSRGFLAASLLVARGSAREDDRATYESLRVALPSRPRAPIDARVLLAELFGSAMPGVDANEPAPIARDVRYESTVLREVIDALESSLAGAPVAVSALGLAEDLAKRELKKTIFFDVARRYLAAQTAAGEPLANAENVLDRAALVILQDPLIALETVGIASSRGDDLIAFAASPELARLWSVHGLGLELAKGESRV
jgi:tetratricopeptide (TPR) repeat protein